METSLANDLLGWDFYQELLSAVTATEALEEYDSQKTYQIGDQMIYRGRLMQAVVAGAGNAPNDSSFWTEVDRFSVDAYNQLWYVGGLRGWLSLEVFQQAIRFIYLQTSSSGLKKANDSKSGSSSIDRAEFENFRTDVKKWCDQRFENMVTWIKRNYDDYLDGDGESYFKLFSSYSCDDQPRTHTPTRKFYFDTLDDGYGCY